MKYNPTIKLYTMVSIIVITASTSMTLGRDYG